MCSYVVSNVVIMLGNVVGDVCSNVSNVVIMSRNVTVAQSWVPHPCQYPPVSPSSEDAYSADSERLRRTRTSLYIYTQTYV